MLWLYVVSDTLIALSYYSIPIALVYFVRKRRDLAFNWMFLMFGAFIFACGTTHVMGLWTIWNPVYWLDGVIKAVTAGISVVTAVVLWPLIPQALALPSPAQLEVANRELQQHILERTSAEAEVRRLNDELERRVVQRTAELEAANKDLEAFSYTVSHDLRAPLRAMDGFSRILVEDHALHLSPEAQRCAGLVRAGAKQMGQLIDDLLSFSRLKHHTLQKEPVAPVELVRQSLQDLRSEQEGRHVDIALGDLPVCHADPALLKQVWINILSNALKFTRRREVARIEIGCDQGKGERIYFVRDNGVGFDMQYVDQLFRVFQRLHPATEFEGTGVGLAIVQRVLHRHGGRVWVESEVHKGATFYFTVEGAAAHG